MQRLPWTLIAMLRQLSPVLIPKATGRIDGLMLAGRVCLVGVVVLAVMVVMAAMVVILPTTAAGQFRLQWSGDSFPQAMETIVPGRLLHLPGAAYITVFSDDRWDLDVWSSLVAEGGGTVRSTLTPTLVPVGAVGEGKSNRASPLTETGGLTDQPPTGARGQTFRVDLWVDPSWDDPPGTPLYAQLGTSLSQGAVMAASYVSPPRWTVDYKGPIEIWAFDADLLSRYSPELINQGAGHTFWLTVRAVPSDEVVLSTSADVDVSESGWLRVILPPVFAPGEYAYRLEVFNSEVGDSKANFPGETDLLEQSGFPETTTIGMGTFLVTTPTDSALGVDTAAELSGLMSGGQASTGLFDHRPEARLQVDGARVAPGQSGRWLVRVFNPGIFSLLEARLYVCLPQGWYLIEAHHPHTRAERDGQDCTALLLGNVPGRSQEQVEFSLTQWPPWGTSPFGPEKEERVDFHLFANVPAEGGTKLLRSVNALLESSAIDLFGDYRVTGWVFHDTDGDGRRGEGEPGIGGVDIVVNGRVHRKSNRNGSFTLRLPRGTYMLWAAGDNGRSRAVSVHVGAEDVIDVGLPFDLLVESSGSDEEGSRYEYHLTSSFSGDGSVVDAQYSLNGSYSGRWGQLVLNTSRMGTDGQLLMPKAHYRLEAQWRSGTPRRVRMGALRPSMPVQAAWKVGFQSLPRLVPGSRSALVSSQVEVGAASDDYWQCRILRAGLDWSAGSTRLSTDVGRAFHSRTDEMGPRTERAGYISLEGTGNVPQIGAGTGSGWRYSFGAYQGRRRQLSPSCGQTPRGGIHLSLGLHPGTPGEEQVIERLGVAMSRWTQDGRAVELSMRTFPIPVLQADRETVRAVTAPTLRITPAVQWGREGPGPGDKAWLRPGLSLESHFGDHRVDVQLGYRPLGEARREVDVQRGEERRFVRWRWQPGRVGFMAAMETNGRDGSLRRGGEAGFSLRDPLRPGVFAGLTRSYLELKRSHSATRLRDELRIEATVSGHRARLRLTGRRPRHPGDQLITSFTTYDTVRASLSVGGALPFVNHPNGSWQLNAGVTGSPAELIHQVSLTFRSGWKRGLWGVEVGQDNRRWTMGKSVDHFLQVQATCRCLQWNFEAGIFHVLRKSVPIGSSASHDLTALRIHAGRPLTSGLSGFVELSLSQIDDLDGRSGLNTPLSLVGDGSNSWLAAGLEWMPTKTDNPIIFGLGLRYLPGDLPGDWQAGGKRIGWFVHIRTPIFSDGFGTVTQEGEER